MPNVKVPLGSSMQFLGHNATVIEPLIYSQEVATAHLDPVYQRRGGVTTHFLQRQNTKPLKS